MYYRMMYMRSRPTTPAYCGSIWGWVDVRTGKHYMTTGAFYEDME